MSLVAQRRALVDLRTLLVSFVRQETSVSDFLPAFRRMLAPFDPPDLTTNSLTEAERNELWIFIQMVGGWFGEDDGLIPRRADWKYGTDSEPYGWIDGPEYRRWIVKRLAHAGIEIGT